MGKRLLRRLLAVLTGLCFLAFLWFGYSFCRKIREYSHGDEDLKQIYDIMGPIRLSVPEYQPSEGTEAETGEFAKEERLEVCARLSDANSDTIGRIRIEGTVIDYPVMHTPNEPNFYLKRGFDKNYSAYGMIYMDGGCSLGAECRNYILYGHHMKNGTMFGSLENYKDEAYFRTHPIIGFDTLGEVHDYEIAAVVKFPADIVTEAFADMLAARTKEEYDALISYLKENSLYDTEVVPEWPEQLVTLTTCEYSQKDGRLLVAARQRQ